MFDFPTGTRYRCGVFFVFFFLSQQHSESQRNAQIRPTAGVRSPPGRFIGRCGRASIRTAMAAALWTFFRTTHTSAFLGVWLGWITTGHSRCVAISARTGFPAARSVARRARACASCSSPNPRPAPPPPPPHQGMPCVNGRPQEFEHQDDFAIATKARFPGTRILQYRITDAVPCTFQREPHQRAPTTPFKKTNPNPKQTRASCTTSWCPTPHTLFGGRMRPTTTAPFARCPTRSTGRGARGTTVRGGPPRPPSPLP